jgi:hypothetical protein
MSVRLVVTINAAPGKGSELAEIFKGRCAEVMKEPGCEQFEAFRSVVDPDKLVWYCSNAGPTRRRSTSTPNSTRRVRPCPRDCASAMASAKTTNTSAPADDAAVAHANREG